MRYWLLVGVALGSLGQSAVRGEPAAVHSHAPGLNPAEQPISTADIDRALRTARGSEADRDRFHAMYMVPTQSDFVGRLEVITEYRRLVLIAEERLAVGEWTFATPMRAAEEALRPWTGKLTIRARIRFHPLKSYARVPIVSLLVADGTGQVLPTDIRTDPQYGLQGPAATTAPLVGVVVDAIFDASAIGRRRRSVVVYGPDGERLPVTVDFAGTR